MTTPPYDAIVLAGGRARRAGGEKLALRRGGQSVLDLAVLAVGDAATVVVVGPVVAVPKVRGQLVWRREDPPYGGPVAAIAAALPELRCERVVVLAGDVPAAGPAVTATLAALGADIDVAVVVDTEGVQQPLLAAYRTDWLRERVAAGGRAARSLLDGARCVEVPDRWDAARDVDTREDAAALGFTSGEGEPSS